MWGCCLLTTEPLSTLQSHQSCHEALGSAHECLKMEMDLGLPDGQTTGGADRQCHIIYTDAQPPAVHSVHPLLYTHSSNAIVTLANDTKIAF